MFDSVPPNLPVEPGSAPIPASPPPPPVPMAPPMDPVSSAGLMPAMKMPSAPGRKEPEDIFADLDHGSESSAAPAPVFDGPGRKSPLKLVLIALGTLLFVAAGGAAVWYFLIRTEPVGVVDTSTPSANSPIVTAEPEPVVETPVTIPNDQNPPNLPPPQPINNPITPPPTEAPDSDEDGLSDPEETLLSTSAALVDSDGDTFADGAELMGGYDPAAQRTSLAASSLYRATSIANSWSVLLPTAWSVGLDATTPGDYAIQTGTPTTFTVHVEQKSGATSFTDWLAANDPTVDPSTLRSITTRAGYTAWHTPDNLVTYITTDTSVVVIHYRLNGAASYDYRALYDHVIQTIRQL